jgi:purine-binding chemotaxis protein CheW
MLLFRAGGLLCGLPLAHVVETMRPLAVEAQAGSPEFVLGVTVVRGQPAPVVDVAALLGAEGPATTRFVALRVGGRPVVLAVDAVVDVRELPIGSMPAPPPLLQSAHHDVVAAMGSLDAELLLVLDEARLLPESVVPG